MKNKPLLNLILSAMFIAIGLVLPFLTGQIQYIGNMLLPMHIPVLLCGFICGWQYGAIVGFILPLFRSMLFSMPVMYPSAIAMAFELATYGFLSGFLFRKAKWQCIKSLYRCMISAMLGGRVVWGIAMTILMSFGADGFTFSAFLTGAFANAVPGIVLQLVIVPAVMLALHRTHLVPFKSKRKANKNVNVEMVAKRINELLTDHDSLFIAIDGRSGAGKTTLALELKNVLDCNVIHGDDFFLTLQQRTQERLDTPGENIDHERLTEEVIIPIKNGEKAKFCPFDCYTMSFKDTVTLEPKKINIIEGAYCCNGHLFPFFDMHIFMDIDKETQKQRIIARNGKNAEIFFTKWIPMEDKYFETCRIKEKCEIIIQTKN